MALEIRTPGGGLWIFSDEVLDQTSRDPAALQQRRDQLFGLPVIEIEKSPNPGERVLTTDH